jgi:Ca-activated chloride channel family protein
MVGGRHRGSVAPPLRALQVLRPPRVLRRRPALAPGIVVAVVIVLLLSGMSFGYVWFAKSGCDGAPTTITVVSSPDQFKTMSGLAQQWRQTEPEVDGKCVAVAVERKDAAEVAAALSASWDPRRDGPRPDVWAPDSSAWLLVAADRPDAAAMIPPAPPKIASSPVVIAMPKPMAEALRWPDAALGWRDLITTFGTGKTWANFAPNENWGKFRIGMTNPATSTAGLHALFGITDFNADDEVSDEELKNGLVFERTVATYVANTAGLFDGLAKADAGSRESALAYVSAFPALERDVSAYNATNPKVPLAPIYPKEGTADADYPYAVLTAQWVNADRQEIANKFYEFLRSETGRKAYGAAGFRGPDRSTSNAPALTAERGFPAKIAKAPRKMTAAGSVTRTVVAWTALRRRANILAVLDTSGSMADKPAGSPASKLQIVQLAAAKATSLFSEGTKIGLWEFATKRTPTTDYRELVPMTPMAGTLNGTPTRLALGGAIRGLRPVGATGLYDTTLAAYLKVQANWEAGRLNLVVIMTDGRNEDKQSITRDDLVRRLQTAARTDRPVQVVTIAYGTDADVGSLQEISRATGGRTFVARNPNDIEKVFLAALFGSR